MHILSQSREQTSLLEHRVATRSRAHAHAICLLTCSSRTPALALSLAPAAASGPIAPKPETTIVDQGVKPTDHKGKYTHISCRCKYLARLPFIAARASSLVTCSFESYEFLNNRESVNLWAKLACIPWIICIPLGGWK